MNGFKEKNNNNRDNSGPTLLPVPTGKHRGSKNDDDDDLINKSRFKIH